LKTLVGGNIGTPAISLVERSTPETVTVLEVPASNSKPSQLPPEDWDVLNVTPDHLDRHRTFAAYVDAKARLFENQQPEDFAVLNADDPTCVDLAGRTRARCSGSAENVKSNRVLSCARVKYCSVAGKRSR